MNRRTFFRSVLAAAATVVARAYAPSAFTMPTLHEAMRDGTLVADWRYAVRIANIDVGDLHPVPKDLVAKMQAAVNRMPRNAPMFMRFAPGIEDRYRALIREEIKPH
jgi:hypothetical protein